MTDRPRRSLTAGTVAGVVLVVAAALGAPSAGQAQAVKPGRQLLRLESGRALSLSAATYRATPPVMALSSVSSELVTIAVIDGRLESGRQKVGPGEALVAPLDGGRIERFRFDARRLGATVPAVWATETRIPLARLAAEQRRQRFWGLLEPANLNASAPAVPQLEAVRRSYLGNEVVAALRIEAAGDRARLATLTARRFSQSLAGRDAPAVASLIDPKPFTDTGADAAAWQSARLAFASRLVADTAWSAAMAAEPSAVPGDQLAFDTGGYRIHLVPRDRAIFVSAVEKLR